MVPPMKCHLFWATSTPLWEWDRSNNFKMRGISRVILGRANSATMSLIWRFLSIIYHISKQMQHVTWQTVTTLHLQVPSASSQSSAKIDSHLLGQTLCKSQLHSFQCCSFEHQMERVLTKILQKHANMATEMLSRNVFDAFIHLTPLAVRL